MAVELPGYGGCPWPMDPACKTDEWDAYDEEVRDRALALASLTLQRLTGYRVGGCPVQVRPIPAQGCCLLYTGGPFPAGVPPFSPQIGLQGEWRNCGIAPRPCEVNLPGPVTQLQEVKIDGVRLTENFQVYNAKTLAWMGIGDCPFPQTQDLRLDDDQPGTFSVTYLNTYPVDAMGAYAVGILALEFAKACNGSKCRLPTGTVAVARSGVTYEIVAGSFPDGFTGIREVDTFIAAWNPRGLKQPSTVWSPTRQERLNTAGGPVAPAHDHYGGTP